MRGSDVHGTVPASPSKSYTHRAMILALLADGTSVLERVLLSDDTLATLGAVRLFGAHITVKGDTCEIGGGDIDCPKETVDVGNSGTTIRLLTGVASLLPCTTVLTGDESIQRRPMEPLIRALEEMGVSCIPTQGEDAAPLMVRGPNRGTRTHIRGDVSSQFLSSLLLSSPLKDMDTDIILTTPLKSRPYVDITLEMMELFGCTCSVTGDGFHVPGGQRYEPRRFTIPGDFSSASFPLVAGALAGRATMTGLDQETRQGDRVILDIMREFGAGVHGTERGVDVTASELHGADVDLSDSPDLFPVVAVLATQASGSSRLYNAGHLRHKETDRIRTTVEFLRRMGAKIEEREDGCAIEGPVRLRGASVDPRGDHRILMSAVVAGIVAQGVTEIGDGECYAVSYPAFLQDMRNLGIEVEMIK